MAEKNISLANRAYTIIKENIMNLTYPPGMTLTEAKLTKRTWYEPQSCAIRYPDATE